MLPKSGEAVLRRDAGLVASSLRHSRPAEGAQSHVCSRRRTGMTGIAAPGGGEKPASRKEA